MRGTKTQVLTTITSTTIASNQISPKNNTQIIHNCPILSPVLLDE